MQHDLTTFLKQATVIPVLVIDDVSDAVPLVEALIAGGISVVEVVLRTPAALDAIKAIKSQVPNVIVGAGTAISPELYQQAVDAGSEFIMTPGFNGALLEQATIHDVPFIPGVSTMSEMMQLYRQGYTLMKLFPAELCGGVAFLKTIQRVMPMLRFCPTGGISAENVGSYRSLDNVACVGGSWLATQKLIKEKQWKTITQLAKAASES